jgi:hypothetical protein
MAGVVPGSLGNEPSKGLFAAGDDDFFAALEGLAIAMYDTVHSGSARQRML